MAKPDSHTPYRVVGSRPVRPDGVDKVIGAAVFGADVRPSDLLHGAVVRSPHAHARIVAIDASAAEAMPGVEAVVTAADFPEIGDAFADLGEGVANLRHSSWRVMAHDKVLFHGHAVAAVAARTAQQARDAADAIRVTYEPLPIVLDVDAARAKDAPILHDDLRTEVLGVERGGPTNVARHVQHRRGDPEAGFEIADAVVERTVRTATVHQGYIEPHSATARFARDGHLTVWCSTQGAFGVRSQLSELLQLPAGEVTVVPTEIGGGFGGKLDVHVEPLAAMLSKKAGHRPVQVTMDRAEVLKATGPTSGTSIRVKIGALEDGRITAAVAELAYEAGAFPGSPVGSGAGVIFAPYKLENLRIDGYDVVVNKPKAGAYRAPGGTPAAFAAEIVIDELARELGIDPLEFRRRNAVQEGDRRADGPVYQRIGFRETLDAAEDHPHWTAAYGEATPGLHGQLGSNVKVGRGVASGFWFNWGGKSSVSASVNADGSVHLVEGSPDIGGSRASIAMQLAEAMQIPYESVHVQVADTDSVGFNDNTGGSRTTFATGWAAYEVGQKLLEELRRRAALLLECEVEDVHYSAGSFESEAGVLSFAELADRLDETGSPVVASASVEPKEYGGGFGTHVVDVAVDVDTGKVEILRYTAVQDVGTAIHPSYVEGQLQGGVAQGVGWALHEAYLYDDEGHLTNASLLDYRMPTSYDLPMIDTVLVEVANPGHPYGVRGVGEVPIVPPPAAIANAIHDATGVRITTLPMSPAVVLEALLGSDAT